jgi:inner membrane protein
MDNVTHTLVGLMLARIGLEKTTPRGAGMMMLAANAPDVDAVFWFGGTLPYLEYHRGYAHSFALMPVVALLPMLLVRARFSWRALAASVVGVLSHLLLDWTNNYGIPLGLPFSAHRFRLDTVNIFDLWIWVILLGAVAATALSGLVNREIGGRGGPAARRGWAWAALLALLAFESARWTAHGRAVNVMAAHLYQGAPPRRVTALAGAFNPLAWRGVVEGAGFAIILPVDLLGEYDPTAGRLYRDAEPVPAMAAALRTRPFAVFSRFAQVPFWKVTAEEDGERVELLDLRFGTPENPGFARVTAVVDPLGVVRRAGFGP